jgi:hypothetical protein
VSLLVGLHII